MKKVEFVCPTCGNSFTVEADYIIPGVEGFCNEVTFVDPTRPRHCRKCFDEMISKLVGDAIEN